MLPALLYLLMRDHLPVGAVREVVLEAIAAGEDPTFSDSHLEAIADSLAEKLQGPAGEVPTPGSWSEERPAPEPEEPVARSIEPIPPPDPGKPRAARVAAQLVFQLNAGIWMKLSDAFAAAGRESHSYTAFRQAVQQLVREGELEATGSTAARVYRRNTEAAAASHGSAESNGAGDTPGIPPVDAEHTSEPDHDDAEKGLKPDDPAGEAEEEDHDGAGKAGGQDRREHRGSDDGGGQSGSPVAGTADGARDGAAETPSAPAPDRELPSDETVILAVRQAKEPISAYELAPRFKLGEEEMEAGLERLASAGELHRQENEDLGALYSFGTAEEKPLVDRVGDFIDAAAADTENFPSGEVFPAEIELHFGIQATKRLEILATLQQEGRVVVLAPRSQYTRYRSSKAKRPSAPRRHGSNGAGQSAESLGSGRVHLSDRSAERRTIELAEQRAAALVADAALPAAREWVRGAGNFNARQLREVFDLEPAAATRLLGTLTQEGRIEQVGDQRAGAYRATNANRDETTLEARALGACSMGDGATLQQVRQKLGVSEGVAQAVLSRLFKGNEVRPKSKGGEIRYKAVA